MVNNFRWQVPGNGNPFDSTLKNWHSHKMSERSIGVLEYINEQKIINEEDFKNNIRDYLQKNYYHEKNESIAKHFYRPLEFIGFIRNDEGYLSLSIDGRNFLKEIHNQNYDKAIDYYILQLLKASYPNTATPKIYLNLFPFRVIFKLLLEKPIPLNWFYTKIPYIKTYEDYLNIENINEESYEKWKTWVLHYLKIWNIIEKDENENIVLTDYKKEFIKSLLDHMNIKDMFFTTEQEFDKVKNSIKCRKRNPSIVNSVVKEYGHVCFFDDTHITFPTYSKSNYVEGHHIIPLALNDSFSEDLDCEENIIPLCPNCHKAMHHATNKFKENLLNQILEYDKDFDKFNLSLEDMKEIYYNKKVASQSQ